MGKNRKGTLPILIDLHYKNSANKFEEFYGDSISYSEIEQMCYIDLKEMVFEKINKNIKFRKFGRYKKILTVKMDILPSEYNKFLIIYGENEIDKRATDDLKLNPTGAIKYKRFNFLNDFTISNIRELTNIEMLKFKKSIIEDDEDLDEDESLDEDLDEELDEELFVKK